MDKDFLAAFVHPADPDLQRRGARAIGGMSAFVPVKNDEKANQVAFDNVRKDKERGGTRWARRHLGGSSRTGHTCKTGVRCGYARAESNLEPEK